MNVKNITEHFSKTLTGIWHDANKPSSIAVAVSGGTDSMALAALTYAWCQKHSVQFYALTVDHGLRKDSDKEAIWVQKSLGSHNIQSHILTLDWNGKAPEKDIENAARIKRYDILSEYCEEHSIPLLLTGHHGDDQIETFLMNLGRGSGVYGLSGMKSLSERNGILLGRPLLSITKAHLAEYCRLEGIYCVEDPMNQDPQFTRVNIRQNRHVLSDKLDISDDRILLAISNLGRVRSLIEQVVEKLKSDAKISEGIYRRTHFQSADQEVALRALSDLIQSISGDTYPPRLQKLEIVFDKVMTPKDFTTNLSGLTISGKADQLIIKK